VRGGWPAAVVAAAAAGALSLAVPTTLGYDAWAWMVWGRELAHLDLATTGGPSFKPLPVLIGAPLSLLGGIAPSVWLAAVRGCAVLALVLVYRLAARLGGPVAGTAAAISLALSADLYRTALLGSAEPALIVCVLAAVDLHLEGRREWTLALVAVAGLIRPEAWVLLGGYGLYLWVREPRRRGLVVIAVALPPALWLGLDWAGSGDPLHASSTATEAAEGSAARASVPAFEVVRRAADAIIVPTLVLAVGAVAEGARRRERRVLWIAALAVGWIAVVAIMAEAGFTGTRRYLAAPAAALCVVAGVGVAWLLDVARTRPARLAMAGAIVALSLVPALVRAREEARALSVARTQADQLAELRHAVRKVGGRRAVRHVGRPAINPWLQTALGWELHAPLDDIQATWASSKRRPHWSPPALVFRAPARLAGPRPVLPAGAHARLVARSGRWRVLQVGA
jgi:hypothetical protein